MSTKAIRELIEDAGRRDDSRRYELTQKALAEVEAIEKAAGVVVDVLGKASAAQDEERMTDALSVMERVASGATT